jgi:pimeloyl-ACP methyl ester carboxylesterase
MSTKAKEQMTEKEHPGIFRRVWSVLRGLRLLLRATLAIGGSWIAFSKLFVPHNLSLPPALGGERKTLAANGLELSYYVTGSGPPLVLLHSVNAAASAYEMKPLYEHFAGTRQVFAIDLPGFGFSARPDLIYSPDLFRDALRAFLEEVVGKPADVVALSLSSEFAALAAHQSPERFKSLSFISPTGLGRSSGETRSSDNRFFNIITSRLWSQALYDLLVTRPSLQWFLNREFASQPADEGLVEYAYLTSHQPGARFAPLYFVGGKLFSPDIDRSYDSLKMPILVLYGKSAFTRFNRVSEYAERPNWFARRISSVRGLLHWEQTEEAVEVLATFLIDYRL